MQWKENWPDTILIACLMTFANCKFKIHDIFNKRAEYALFRLKTTFYESGEKTGRLLARQLKEQSTAHVIPAIRSGGSLVTSSKGINEVFKDFYEKLYKSSGTPNKLSLQNFFMNINLSNNHLNR